MGEGCGDLVAGTPRGPRTGEQVSVLGTPAAGRGDGVLPDTPGCKEGGGAPDSACGTLGDPSVWSDSRSSG